MLSNNHLIKLIFIDSTILSVKLYLGCFVNIICLFSIGGSYKSEFWENLTLFMFSNKCSIELTFPIFYIDFDCS